jgi:hypothetical protein
MISRYTESITKASGKTESAMDTDVAIILITP